MERFEEYEGMTFNGSTEEQRHEIWKLLFENNLLYDKQESIDFELLLLENNQFYMLQNNEGFIPAYCSGGIPIKNIPFEEFKNRLTK